MNPLSTMLLIRPTHNLADGLEHLLSVYPKANETGAIQSKNLDSLYGVITFKERYIFFASSR